MSRHAFRFLRAGVLVAASVVTIYAQGRGTVEWTTSGFDAQRSGWLRSDARLTKDAVQKGEFAFLWKMKIREHQPPAELADGAGAARSLDRLPWFQEPGVLRRQRRSHLRDGHRSRATVVDDGPQLLGGDRRTAAELMELSGRADGDAEPPHRAGARRRRRPGRWRPSRRSQRQRRRRTGKGRRGPESAAAGSGSARRASAASGPFDRPGQARGRGPAPDRFRRCRSAVRGRRRRLSPQPATSATARTPSPPLPFLPPDAKAVGADLGGRHRLHHDLRRVRRRAQRGLGDRSHEGRRRTETAGRGRPAARASRERRGCPSAATARSTWRSERPHQAHRAPRLADSVVALDRESLMSKDWFTAPGADFNATPIVIRHANKDLIAATANDGTPVSAGWRVAGRQRSQDAARGVGQVHRGRRRQRARHVPGRGRRPLDLHHGVGDGRRTASSHSR